MSSRDTPSVGAVMSCMGFLARMFLGVVCLILFTDFVKKYGAVVYDRIFDLADGDADVISLMFCGFSFVTLAGCWIWSAKTRRKHSRRA